MEVNLIFTYIVLAIFWVLSRRVKRLNKFNEACNLKIVSVLDLPDRHKLFVVESGKDEFMVLTGRAGVELIQIQRSLQGLADLHIADQADPVEIIQ